MNNEYSEKRNCDWCGKVVLAPDLFHLSYFQGEEFDHKGRILRQIDLCEGCIKRIEELAGIERVPSVKE